MLGELSNIRGFPFNIYAMVKSIDFKRIPFIIFAMAEVAMDIPNIRYYIEKLEILL